MSRSPSLTSLRAFSVVGQCLSFTQAAYRLGVTQSAVSRQIRQLEEALDTPLFRRIGNAVALTEAGAALHERLTDAFGQIDDAIRDAHAVVPRQKLTVLAPPTFSTRWLARRMQDFRSRHEDLDLAIHTRPDEAVRFDCTIRYGCLPRDRHLSNPILTEQHILVCAPELLDEGEAWRNTAVLHVLDGISRMQTWENWLQLSTEFAGVLPQNVMELATLDMVIEAARAGAGIALIDRNMIECELATGQLVPIDPTTMTGPYTYWLDVTHDQISRSRVARFSRWLRQSVDG
ncbi:LysR substrate-binding domain-containing protein [Paracoccus homiensis]|uniref:DNA-binding transcriptional regulator, LysR family n=1 Tax=Paracoccus homiensis TaxID=364199 RepID=A0A1I0JJT3_9RHOB|nr:LysR substrate-binding domain-containing protein [Paracoccus homiensis]SEU10665.1 DNA-binding transcriptional regulator, LysR family [Paracoccus homiensis]